MEKLQFENLITKKQNLDLSVEFFSFCLILMFLVDVFPYLHVHALYIHMNIFGCADRRAVVFNQHTGGHQTL